MVLVESLEDGSESREIFELQIEDIRSAVSLYTTLLRIRSTGEEGDRHTHAYNDRLWRLHQITRRYRLRLRLRLCGVTPSNARLYSTFPVATCSTRLHARLLYGCASRR